MGLHLTSGDTARLSATVEALLAPATGLDPVPWWQGVEARLSDLFGGANAMITWPEGSRLRYFGRHLDADTVRRLETLSAADPETGLHINADPAVVAWFEYRRANAVQVWHEAENFAVMQRAGLDGQRGLFYNEGLLPARFLDCSGTTTASRHGEMFLTVGYDRRGQGRFGDGDAEVLRLLLPVIRTAHHQLSAFAPRQTALVATVDAIRDALLVLAPDGRELHRNAALCGALDAEPARDTVVAAMHAVARALLGHRLAAVRPERVVATARARYTLRATYAPAALWGMVGVVQVSLEVAAVPAAHSAPTAPDLPVRVDPTLIASSALGLTSREIEVAQLLARRLSNAELAAALGVSAHTARHHTERVLQKLGVRRRGEVARVLMAAAR